MIDLEKFTNEYWLLLRRHAYRMTLDLLDAEDVVQEVMLRAVEMGPALESVPDLIEWMQQAVAEAALTRLRERKSLPLSEFDLPDPVQTTGPGGRALKGGEDWPGVGLDFLFALQYMTPEQRLVLSLRDGAEDGDRIAAAALGMTIQEVFAVVDRAGQWREAIRKQWGRNVPFKPREPSPASERVFARFLDALRMRDKALLQGLLWADAELVVRGERRTGDDFVAVACAELLQRMGERLRFAPVWLNGCRGALAWTWREGRGEWLRCALIIAVCDDKAVRALKWYLDGHLLRAIEADEPA